jgi:hypothetical protein
MHIPKLKNEHLPPDLRECMKLFTMTLMELKDDARIDQSFMNNAIISRLFVDYVVSHMLTFEFTCRSIFVG